ncbi:hypothetical protein LINPERHAP2_LOCUS41521 [Linum perenne]
MEVAIPTPATEFNFDSSCSSPYLTAPSSPLPFGSTAGNTSFFSAPTSPTPATTGRASNSDFEFDFGGQLSRSSFSAADELFHCGRILPLRSPPESSSPKIRVSDFEESEERGREWRIFTSCSSYNFDSDVNSSSAASSGRRGGGGGARSVPPVRISDVMSEPDDDEYDGRKTKQSYAAAFLSAVKGGGGRYKKWKIRDFLLFRSASEGRATSSEQLMAAKYAVLTRRTSLPPSPTADGSGKGSSFRSTESSFGSSRRLKPSAAVVSAHEMHYTVNRAAAEEMKRKTYLPYKQGLLGCLGFNPVGPDISRSIGSLTRG